MGRGAAPRVVVARG